MASVPVSASSIRMVRNRSTTNFAITDLAGIGCFRNGLQYAVTHVVADGDFNLDLGQKIHHVLCTSVEFGMAFWRPNPLTSVTVTP